MLDTSKIQFKHLSIECDGKHTKIVVDGEDCSKRTSEIDFHFNHDANNGLPSIKITRNLEFVPDIANDGE